MNMKTVKVNFEVEMFVGISNSFIENLTDDVVLDDFIKDAAIDCLVGGHYTIKNFGWTEEDE